MLEILIQERGFELEMPIENLAKQTDGYSGREIEQICLAMIESMLWRQNPTLEQLVQQGNKLYLTTPSSWMSLSLTTLALPCKVVAHKPLPMCCPSLNVGPS